MVAIECRTLRRAEGLAFVPGPPLPGLQGKPEVWSAAFFSSSLIGSPVLSQVSLRLTTHAWAGKLRRLALRTAHSPSDYTVRGTACVSCTSGSTSASQEGTRTSQTGLFSSPPSQPGELRVAPFLAVRRDASRCLARVSAPDAPFTPCRSFSEQRLESLFGRYGDIERVSLLWLSTLPTPGAHILFKSAKVGLRSGNFTAALVLAADGCPG